MSDPERPAAESAESAKEIDVKEASESEPPAKKPKTGDEGMAGAAYGRAAPSVDPRPILYKVHRAAYFFSDLSQPDELKLPAALLPPLKKVVIAAQHGDKAGLQAALESLELREGGGLPKDIFVWLPLPNHLEYDGEDGKTAQKYLAVVKMLHEHGAAIREDELLSACGRFGFTTAPDIMSNGSLNRVLDWAAQWGIVPVFRYLHEHGANCAFLIGDTCGEGGVELLRYMLSHGLLPTPAQAEKEGTTEHFSVSCGFSYARMNRKHEVVQFLVEEAGYSAAIFTDDGERHEPLS